MKKENLSMAKPCVWLHTFKFSVTENFTSWRICPWRDRVELKTIEPQNDCPSVKERIEYYYSVNHCTYIVYIRMGSREKKVVI